MGRRLFDHHLPFGPRGPQGATGATGATGAAGANGADGADGLDTGLWTWVNGVSPVVSTDLGIIAGVLLPFASVVTTTMVPSNVTHLYAMRFVVPRAGLKVAELRFNVTISGANSNARLAIYNSGSGGLHDIMPDDVLYESGSIAMSGGVGMRTVAPNLTVDPGHYWVSFNTNHGEGGVSNSTINGIGTGFQTAFGYGTTFAPVAHLTDSSATPLGAFPDPWSSTEMPNIATVPLVRIAFEEV
jgi:hypothetical protein